MSDVPRVLVTGASGYIATHVVQQLQQTGQYLVRGTVRSLKNPQKVDPLKKLCDNPKYELELVEADLTKEDGWEEAVRGCTYVLHMASPFPTDRPKDENEIIRPAVDGTLHVLRAARKVGGIKRIVLTSSCAAVSEGFNGGSRPYTEEDWTDTSKPLDSYLKSKTLAERAAWDFLKDLPDSEKFELAVTNPVLVMGPSLCGSVSTSLSIMQRYLDHTMPGMPKVSLPIVDVRDVALAHLRAMTNPDAAGHRHILCNEAMWMSDIGKVLEKEFKPLGYNIPTCTIPKALVVMGSWFDKSLRPVVPSIDKITEYDTTRMRSVLGITPIDKNQTLLEMAYNMIDAGQVKKTDKYKQMYPNGKKF